MTVADAGGASTSAADVDSSKPNQTKQIRLKDVPPSAFRKGRSKHQGSAPVPQVLNISVKMSGGMISAVRSVPWSAAPATALTADRPLPPPFFTLVCMPCDARTVSNDSYCDALGCLALCGRQRLGLLFATAVDGESASSSPAVAAAMSLERLSRQCSPVHRKNRSSCTFKPSAPNS